MNMETPAEHGVVVFHTTSAAIKADKVLRNANVEAKLVPIPRYISSDCGLALRFHWKERDNIAGILERAGLELAGMHPLEQHGLK